jgi:RimJ/RimL family protein N-acetyltransferase
MLEYRGDPAVATYLTHPALDLAAVRLAVGRSVALWSSQDHERFNLLFAVDLDNVLIGEVHAWNTAESLQPTSPDPAEVWIGYAFNPRYRGFGYATESVRGSIEWLFARAAHSVFANCYLDNIASIALLERLDFTECARYSAEQDATQKHAASCRMRLDRP